MHRQEMSMQTCSHFKTVEGPFPFRKLVGTEKDWKNKGLCQGHTVYVIEVHSLFNCITYRYILPNKTVSLTKYVNHSTAKTQHLKGSGICESVYAFVTVFDTAALQDEC